MSGQGVRTHHRRASGQHIRIGYAIVRVWWSGVLRVLLGNPDGVAPPTFHPNVSHPEFCSIAIPPRCLSSGILLRRHFTRMSLIRNSSPQTFHPDILHPAPDAGWERRVFQLPRLDISGSSDSAYLESFTVILHSAAVFSWSFPICLTDILRYFSAQCRGVLLKLPDICDRHLEIFCFRYFMSKSPKSPCNPPIIGFLSY